MSVLIYKLCNVNDCYKGSTKQVIESGTYKIEKVVKVDAQERFKKEQEFINALSILNQYILNNMVSFVMIINDFLAHQKKKSD